MKEVSAVSRCGFCSLPAVYGELRDSRIAEVCAMKTSKLTLASLLLIASASLALAQGGTYAQIDVPGATYTECLGINNAGDLAGEYGDINGAHGFLLSQGTYTTINYPGSSVTGLTGINDVGQIVGFAGGGFLYDIATQTFTDVVYPGANLTAPYGINDAGTIVGYIQIGGIGSHGFELVGSTYREIQPPGEGNSDSQVFGISGAGEIIGVASADFSLIRGKYQRIPIPLPKAGVAGINASGAAMAGVYFPNFGSVASGFVLQGKTLTLLNFPGATDTFASSINDVGVVTGTFYDGSATHGFTWTPPTDVAQK
jgi:uncharacterized membrane protein